MYLTMFHTITVIQLSVRFIFLVRNMRDTNDFVNHLMKYFLFFNKTQIEPCHEKAGLLPMRK